MSVKSSIEGEKLVLTLDNGDKKAFNDILRRWNFKDEESLVKFALSILTVSKDFVITINTSDEGEIKVKPSENFLKHK